MSTTSSRRRDDRSAARFVATSATYFAASMLALAGAFQVLAGIAAIAEDEIYVVGADYTLGLDLTVWGWVHLLIGVLALATAVGIFTGKAWAFVAGIGIVFISALGNFAFLPYYPLWAVVVITLDVVVLWALSQRLADPGR